MKNLQFVHIPKTGGMSIEDTYRDQNWGRFGDQRVIPGKTSPFCTFWHYHDNHVFLMENTDTFCVVREPINRILSNYRYGFPGLSGKDNVKDDVQKMNGFLSNIFKNIDENPYIFDNHYRPQSEFADRCTHVLLFDNIDFEVADLVNKYGIDPRKLLHSNKTSHKFKYISREGINEKNMEFIRNYYKADFELYEKLNRRHSSRG